MRRHTGSVAAQMPSVQAEQLRARPVLSQALCSRVFTVCTLVVETVPRGYGSGSGKLLSNACQLSDRHMRHDLLPLVAGCARFFVVVLFAELGGPLPPRTVEGRTGPVGTAPLMVCVW